jgi:hypothetical protein
MRTTLNLSLVLLSVSLFHPPLQLYAATGDPEPQDAVQAVLAAFDRYDLVALGEAHRNQNVHDFALALIRSADFPRKVNDIVVEFGNGRYQSVMDRYVDGADVPAPELRRVWRDTVNILVWDAPVYERFFSVVREVNRHLPKVGRIRVLLGDPDFDWGRIDSNEQWEKVAAQRDTHAAGVIVKEVLQKRRKALLFYGSPHLTRESAYLAFGGRTQAPSLTEMLERDHDRKVFVIWPEMAGWGEISESYGRLAGWRAPSVALVKDTWLGNQTLGPPGETPRLQELADAFLYLGPVRSLRQSVPPAKLYRDAAYLAELKRRDRISGGFNSDELQRWTNLLKRDPRPE